MDVWCTKRSLPPSSGLMKPYPFESLNHFTVPVAMKTPPSPSRERVVGGVSRPVTRSVEPLTLPHARSTGSELEAELDRGEDCGDGPEKDVEVDRSRPLVARAHQPGPGRPLVEIRGSHESRALHHAFLSAPRRNPGSYVSVRGCPLALRRVPAWLATR